MSFIQTVPTTLSTVPTAQWVFFSSKRAVHYLLQRWEPQPGTLLAAVNTATASAIKEKGYSVAFTGTGTNLQQTAHLFAQRASNTTVLFPQSSQSARSIQLALPPNIRVVDLVVYETEELKRDRVPTADVVIFTSPSNVRGYLLSRHWNKQQKAVAIGPTTAQELDKNGIPHVVAWGYSETALSDAISTLVFS